jgi:hypothetical protein
MTDPAPHIWARCQDCKHYRPVTFSCHVWIYKHVSGEFLAAECHTYEPREVPDVQADTV